MERIGRYIQVFHEGDSHHGWEHAAMAFGRPAGAASIDALFTVPFAARRRLQRRARVPGAPDRSEEIVFVGGAHALFCCGSSSRAAAARQRAVDLERFAQLKRESGHELNKAPQARKTVTILGFRAAF